MSIRPINPGNNQSDLRRPVERGGNIATAIHVIRSSDLPFDRDAPRERQISSAWVANPDISSRAVSTLRNEMRPVDRDAPRDANNTTAQREPFLYSHDPRSTDIARADNRRRQEPAPQSNTGKDAPRNGGWVTR